MLPAEELNGENSEGKQDSKSDEQDILVCFDLVIEILSRLPVKSLMRFRSVSKTWLALICSPEFTKSHMSLSANKQDYTNHRLMLKICHPEHNLKDCSLKSLLYEPVIEESDLDYHVENFGRYPMVRGSINGLICLVNEVKELFLWNPTIRKYKKLPDFKTKVSDVGHFLYGFGYDEIHDDYKVVRICNYISHQCDFQEVSMYSLKNDFWRRIDCPRNGTGLISPGKFVNGKLHWATTAGIGYERGWSITSFDLADEKWGKVERPCYGEGDGILMLGAFGSNLSMICKNSTSHVDVWAMKEYGNKESWIKMFTLNYTPEPLGYFLSESFCLSKRGEFLVMFESILMICNPEDNSIRFPKCPKFGSGLFVDIYIESLVCPLSQNEPRTQQE